MLGVAAVGWVLGFTASPMADWGVSDWVGFAAVTVVIVAIAVY
jgi:hypothetical protein